MTPFASKDILIFNSYLLMLRDLKFPVIKYNRKLGLTRANVGEHFWQYYIKSGDSFGVIKALWWEFRQETHETKIEIPDLWRKVNGGWQIVY